MNKTIKIAVAITILLLSFIGCEREKDMRDKYVGNWYFITEKIFSCRDSTPYTALDKRETIYYSGKIKLGNVADELIIQFAEDEAEIKVLLDKEENLWETYPTYYMANCLQCSLGSFATKNIINLKFHTFDIYNSDCAIEYATTGTKQKGDKK